MSDSGSEGAFADVLAGGGGPKPESAPVEAPWWQEVCEKIAAGDTVDVVRAGLAVQQQAQHFAREERLSAERATLEQVEAETQRSRTRVTLIAALESRDRRIGDLERALQDLKDTKDDPEPEHQEFVTRAVDNPFGVVVGGERKGAKAELSSAQID